ncbi:hypothetical protein C8Q75DRAFT_890210 [Abortiporus biennis]|nr:hypothetical protein C8Q75DRAFT_890210 [Abortiporus biennis]
MAKSSDNPHTQNHLKRSSEEMLNASHPQIKNHATTVKEAQEFIKVEMEDCIYDNHPDFIDNMFDKIDETECQQILDTLQENGLWTPEMISATGEVDPAHWTHLPREPPNEASLYAPLTDILNAITELVPNNTHDDVRLVWKDKHSIAPSTLWKGTNTNTRPDIIAEYASTETELDDATAEEPWWYRIAIILELKKLSPEATPTLLQMLQYARQVFKEQPFRRFLFGFTFHRTGMTFWHCDRAGTIGSEMVDIHQSPLAFIQCIASCALMKPVEHGYDPTLRAYDSIAKEEYLPWKMPRTVMMEEKASKHPVLPDICWVVDMPSYGPDGKSQREDFVLFTAISLNRGEVVKGRAGRVWLAHKRDEVEKDMPLKEQEIFVFKDNWHDIRRPTEGEHYEGQGPVDGIAKLYTYETVKVDNEIDSTSNARRSLEPTPDAKPLRLQVIHNPPADKFQTYIEASMQRYADNLPIDIADLRRWIDMLERGASQPVYHREHHRLLLRSYGHPITEFVSRKELVVVFRCAVNGHWLLVLMKYLHRDVSRGNVVITDADITSPNKGVLIDQDYTIGNFDVHTATECDTRTGTPAFMAVELLTGSPMMLQDERPQTQRKLTREEKSTRIKNKKLATADTKSKKGETAPIYHSPIHDLESFFWLLCWICLTRSGPSTSRLGELDVKSNKDDQKIALLIHDLFREEDMIKLGENKRKYFVNSKYFAELLASLSPYFADFDSLIEELRGVLYYAYENQGFDGLHEDFLEHLDLFIDWLDQNEVDIPLVKNQADMIKRAEWRRMQHAYKVFEDAGGVDDTEVPGDDEPGSPTPAKRLKTTSRK